MWVTAQEEVTEDLLSHRLGVAGGSEPRVDFELLVGLVMSERAVQTLLLINPLLTVAEAGSVLQLTSVLMMKVNRMSQSMRCLPEVGRLGACLVKLEEIAGGDMEEAARKLLQTELDVQAAKLAGMLGAKRCYCVVEEGTVRFDPRYLSSSDFRESSHYLLLTAYHLPLTTHHSLLTTHYSLLATHYALRTTHHSLLTTHYSRLTTHYILHPTHCSLLTTHYSRLTTHYSLCTTMYDVLCTIYSLLPTYYFLLADYLGTWVLRYLLLLLTTYYLGTWPSSSSPASCCESSRWEKIFPPAQPTPTVPRLQKGKAPLPYAARAPLFRPYRLS